MIDSGASGNFISTSFVQRNGIATRQKKDGGYELMVADGSSLSVVDSETMPLILAIQQHHENVCLDVVDMASHDVVMGTPWLEKHNPLVDWRKRVLKFERCGCVTDIHPIHRQRAMVDEERQFCELERQPTTYSDRTGKEMVSTDTEPAQPGHKVREKGRINAPPEIPKEFKKWKPLFQEEEGLAALPRH